MTLFKKLMVAVAAGALTTAGTVAYAQVEARIAFARGNDNASATGTITGQQYRDYLVGVRAGQRLGVSLTGNAYFNVMEPGSRDVAVYNSSVEGNELTNYALARSGDYRIRVYQMGAAERSRRPTRFTLSVSVMNN